MAAPLPPLLRSRPQQRALGAAVLLLAALGFLPLVAGPGYEAALVAGLMLPSLGAVAVGVEGCQRDLRPLYAIGRGAATGALLAVAGLAVTFVHGARVGFCDPAEGSAYFALGPGVGTVLGGVWGAIVGLFVRRGRSKVTLVWKAGACAAVGPLAGIVVSLYRFYSSPMVFAYDPFFGFFAGTLYDTVIDSLGGLVTYRIGSAATLVAVVCVASRLERRRERFVWKSQGGGGVALLAVAATCTSLGLSMAGPELGHWQTAQTIREALGRQVDGKRCRVAYSAAILARDAELFAWECDAHVAQIEGYLGTRGPEHIDVYLFASAGQKGRLMGAANTYIAKPWRRETYLQAAGFPHPVLGHELAHVVAGAFGTGPFRVSGPLGGIVPDPGRIEGIAVAASPRPRDDLSLQQWARAMLDLGLLPKLGRVFKLSFLGEPSSKAYTVAGAFVDWFHGAYGAAAVRRWYGGSSLPEVTGGKGLAALEAEWHASLVEVTVSDEAMEVARARFDRPAIFGRRCPHVVDRLASAGSASLRQLDHRGALDAFDEVLRLDPHHFGARMGRAHCALRAGDTEEARRRYQAVADDEQTKRVLRARGDEAIGDLDLLAGDLDSARERYDHVSALVVNEDALRTLDVKRGAKRPRARAAVASLLVGDAELGADLVAAAALIGQWAGAEPDDGLPEYLLGKNLYNRGRWTEAAAHFDRALDKRLESPRVRREALRMKLVVACARRDIAAAKTAFTEWRAMQGISASRRASLERFAVRCGAL